MFLIHHACVETQTTEPISAGEEAKCPVIGGIQGVCKGESRETVRLMALAERVILKQSEDKAGLGHTWEDNKKISFPSIKTLAILAKATTARGEHTHTHTHKETYAQEVN